MTYADQLAAFLGLVTWQITGQPVIGREDIDAVVKLAETAGIELTDDERDRVAGVRATAARLEGRS